MKLVIKHTNGLFYCGGDRWSNLKSEAQAYDSPKELPGYICRGIKRYELRLCCLHPMAAGYFDGPLAAYSVAEVEWKGGN